MNTLGWGGQVNQHMVIKFEDETIRGSKRKRCSQRVTENKYLLSSWCVREIMGWGGKIEMRIETKRQKSRNIST